MCAKFDQPDPRDRAIDRLIEKALGPHTASGASSAGACPDAELVAAYADQGLADSERTQLETHFAACERCQQVLAALGAGLEAPVGESVAVMPAPAAAPATPRPAVRPVPSPQRWLLWLSPAFGAAAAALLWMVLRPSAPQPVQTAADYSRAAEQETRALNVPVAPEAAPPSADALRDAQAVDRFSKAESAEKKDSATDTRERSLAQLTEPRADPAPVPAALPAPAVRSEVATGAVQPQASVAQAMTAPPAPTEQAAPPPVAPGRSQAAANEQAPLQARTTAAFGMALPQQAAAQTGQASRDAAAQVNLYTFAPPDGTASWRLGAGGRIERSIDRGQTWQPQTSGITTDLIAGSAANKDVAWVIGRGRVILRTTDGEHWERIPALAGVTSEWAAVAAHDAMRATVVAEDLRRFSTEDGGRTWTQQQ